MTTSPEEFGAALPDAVAGIAGRAMQQIVLVVEANVKKRTPVVTGTLRRSITGQVREGGMLGVVGTKVIYARPVDRRRKYMQRGLDDSQGQIARILEEAGLAGLLEATK